MEIQRSGHIIPAHRHNLSVGVTANRGGMNPRQNVALRSALVLLAMVRNVVAFHHGDCRGGDEEAHQAVRAVLPMMPIIGHPPLIETMRAFCECDILRSALDYGERNKQSSTKCSSSSRYRKRLRRSCGAERGRQCGSHAEQDASATGRKRS